MAEIKRPRVRKARQAFVQAELAANEDMTRERARATFETLSKSMEGRTKIVQTAGLDPAVRRETKKAIRQYAQAKQKPVVNVEPESSPTGTQPGNQDATAAANNLRASTAYPATSTSQTRPTVKTIPGWKAGQTSYKTPTKINQPSTASQAYQKANKVADAIMDKTIGFGQFQIGTGLGSLARTFTNPWVNAAGRVINKNPNLPVASGKEATLTTILTAADIATGRLVSTARASLPANAIFKPSLLEKVSGIPGSVARRFGGKVRSLAEELELIGKKPPVPKTPKYEPGVGTSRSPFRDSADEYVSKSPYGPKYPKENVPEVTTPTVPTSPTVPSSGGTIPPNVTFLGKSEQVSSVINPGSQTPKTRVRINAKGGVGGKPYGPERPPAPEVPFAAEPPPPAIPPEWRKELFGGKMPKIEQAAPVSSPKKGPSTRAAEIQAKVDQEISTGVTKVSKSGKGSTPKSTKGSTAQMKAEDAAEWDKLIDASNKKKSADLPVETKPASPPVSPTREELAKMTDAERTIAFKQHQQEARRRAVNAGRGRDVLMQLTRSNDPTVQRWATAIRDNPQAASDFIKNYTGKTADEYVAEILRSQANKTPKTPKAPKAGKEPKIPQSRVGATGTGVAGITESKGAQIKDIMGKGKKK